MKITGFVAWVVVAAATLGACGDNELTIEQACAEQAQAWCLAVPPPRGYPPDCEKLYRSDCEPVARRVPVDEQDDCLIDIATRELVICVPPSCVATWHIGDALHHFLTCPPPSPTRPLPPR